MQVKKVDQTLEIAQKTWLKPSKREIWHHLWIAWRYKHQNRCDRKTKNNFENTKVKIPKWCKYQNLRLSRQEETFLTAPVADAAPIVCWNRKMEWLRGYFTQSEKYFKFEAFDYQWLLEVQKCRKWRFEKIEKCLKSQNVDKLRWSPLTMEFIIVKEFANIQLDPLKIGDAHAPANSSAIAPTIPRFIHPIRTKTSMHEHPIKQKSTQRGFQR